jgi:hypothetical protein
MRSMWIGALILSTIGAAAHAADTMAGGAAFGGPSQDLGDGVCYLFNAGSTSVNISPIKIYDEVANPYAVNTNNCTSPGPKPLPPNRSCRTVSRIFNATAYSCKAMVANKANLRGRLEIRNPSGVVLTAVDLR